jgi:phosphoinositide-3-kinase regulatory subunit 4
MGNQPSRPSTALDSYVEELGADVIYDKRLVCMSCSSLSISTVQLIIGRRLVWLACSIGTSRFLKTIKARHTNGPLLIKIFFKPQAPQGISLAAHRRRLKGEPQD